MSVAVDRPGSEVGTALTALAGGRPIVLRDRGADVGALVVDARSSATESVAFLVRHTSGLLIAAAPATIWQRLRVPVSPVRDRMDGALGYRVSVDGVGTGTGISATSRAATLRRLADPTTDPEDLVRPGHVLTACAERTDLYTAAALPAAAVELVRFGGGVPVAAYAHLVGQADPCALACSAEALAFARRFGLRVVEVDDVRRSVEAWDLGVAG